VRYRWRDLPALARTPVGRAQIRKGIARRTWPVVRRAAALHRQTRGRRCRVVAVVGSFGKTTTARGAAAALGLDAAEVPAGNAYLAIARRILGIRPADRHLVVEAGITHPGQMAEYAGVVQPDVTVVTWIGNTHQDALRTLDNTAREKGDMVRALPSDGVAILNGDDPRVRAMAGWTRAPTITFGTGGDNDVRATDIDADPVLGTRFTLHIDGSRHDVRLRLIGRHMVYPALAAIAVAHAEGRSVDHILPALARLPQTPGRMELIRLCGGVLLLRDDRKSSLESVHLALDTFERLPVKRRVVVLHEPTDEQAPDGIVFPPLGRRLAGIADRLFFMGSPERFRQIRLGAGGSRGEPRGSRGEPLWHRLDPDVIEVLDRLKPTLQEGDGLLIKGPRSGRLDRILLGLQGRTVRCRAPECDAPILCPACPMLEPGWDRRRVVI
jgi:UDP-N-acetylmuramoyl-tripeptide--D-alanyl-D-alanine ligase